MSRRVVVVFCLSLAGWFANAASAEPPLEPETVAVIGTGRVGSAIGPRLAEVGYQVVYGSRAPQSEETRALVAATGGDVRAMTPVEAARSADFILLAVPWEAAPDLVVAFGELGERIVIDCTNPLRFLSDRLELTTESAGEQLAALAKGGHVVKALNTTTAGNMRDPAAAGGPVSIPIAGDDPDARRRVAELVRRIGLDPVDAGPIRHARFLEAMAGLYINMNVFYAPEGGFEFVIRAPAP